MMSLFLYTQLYFGAVSLKAVMTRQSQHESDAISNTVFCVVTLCSPVTVYQIFKGICCLGGLP